MLQRKQSLRASYAQRLRDSGKPFPTLQRASLKRGKSLKKVSKAKRNALEKYKVLRLDFLSRQRECECCPVLGINRPRRATEVHHRQGRAGSLFLDVSTWIAVCGTCHEQIHTAPAWAREMGLLAPAGEWNRPHRKNALA